MYISFLLRCFGVFMVFMSSISGFWIVAWFLILRHQKIFREIVIGKESFKIPTLTPTLKTQNCQPNSTPNLTPNPIPQISLVHNHLKIPDLYLPLPMTDSIRTDNEHNEQFHQIDSNIKSNEIPKHRGVVIDTLKNVNNRRNNPRIFNANISNVPISPLRVIPNWFDN